jgi:hypothetical protein
MYRHLAAHPEAKIALTGWNAYSRIDAVTGLGDALARLYIDSDAWTNLHGWDGQVQSLAPMRRPGPNFRLVRAPAWSSAPAAVRRWSPWPPAPR